jgi:hypothetical protein
LNARLNPIGLQYAAMDLAGRRGLGLHLLVRTGYGSGAAPEFQSEDQFFHAILLRWRLRRAYRLQQLLQLLERLGVICTASSCGFLEFGRMAAGGGSSRT